jgi:antirestriction protein ArdC
MSDTVYRIVTEKILAQLEQGVAPWRKPWRAATAFPRSINGHRYRGINVFLLATQGYTSPYWLSRKEINRRGGRIRKGEHGTVIVFWKRLQVADEDSGETKTIPLLRYYNVWNLEQTDDVTVPQSLAAASTVHPAPTAEQRHHAAAAIVAGYPNTPTIHEDGDAAWYRPSDDLVNVPPRARFEDLDEFYSTLFHELTHSTAHPSRLGRDCDYVFGSHSYGREELVAEMGAAFLNAEAGIETTVPNSAAYLAGWITKISEDVRAVVVAAGAAQRAADHILARTQTPAGTPEIPGQPMLAQRMAA